MSDECREVEPIVNSDLKACERCASPKVRVEYWEDCDSYRGECCACEYSPDWWSDTEEDAIRYWNTRPLEDALRAECDNVMKAQREAEGMVERLIEASKVVIANAYENEGWVLLNSIVKIQTLIDEWQKEQR